MASMYAGPSHLTRLSPPARSWAMLGAAMFVTVESITSTTSASSTRARIAHISRPDSALTSPEDCVTLVIAHLPAGLERRQVRRTVPRALPNCAQ